ncbi:MAG TPA: cobalt ABC transporter ATP-binding protein [Spirochaetia bacterium]|nr:cobalt ABC transporter ATP-binding protein [Spirochaetia bacterium]
MSHHYMHVDGLSFSWPGGIRALDNITLAVKHGESLALIGSNGAGKSTLLLHLCGSIIPQSGAVDIGGVTVHKNNLKLIRRSVGMVFQNADDSLFMPSVYEEAAFGPRNLDLDEEHVAKKAEAALNLTGIMHLKDRPVYRLSAGEKKLASIAAVLSLEPSILLLDEPSASLDPKSRRNLINLLSGFSHTKIIATHDLDLALALCSRAVILNAGKIAADGNIIEIMKNAELLEKNRLEQPLSLRY